MIHIRRLFFGMLILTLSIAAIGSFFWGAYWIFTKIIDTIGWDGLSYLILGGFGVMILGAGSYQIGKSIE